MAADEPNPDELEIADELIAERRSEAPGETPEDMTAWQRPITAVIDVINYRAGQLIALLMIPLITVVVYEVLSRNSFVILQDAGFEDLARSVFRAMGRDADIEFVETPEAIRDRYQYFTQADMSRLRNAGYSRPSTSLEDGVGQYIRDYLMAADPYA